MKIAHIKLISYMPTKTGLEKRVGYITIGCQPATMSWSVEEPNNCTIAVSYCQPGVTFKKKHGVRAINNRLNRNVERPAEPNDKVFHIKATKANWLNEALMKIAANERSWVNRSLWAWRNDISWIFDAPEPMKMDQAKTKEQLWEKVTIYPATFLNGHSVRKVNLAKKDDLATLAAKNQGG